MKGRNRVIVGVHLFSVLLGTSMGCTSLLGPDLPEGALRLEPVPVEYDDWWSLVERCSGLSGALGDIDWYFVPGVSTIPGSDGATGQYQRGRHRIVLGGDNVRVGFTVRHEMLHALSGGGGHPRHLFLERCGAVVDCGEKCREEAGGPATWDLSHPLATLDELRVSAAVLPSLVHLSSETRGCVTIAVSVRNVSDGARTVDVGRGTAFGWLLDGWGGGSGGGPILVDSVIAIEHSASWTWVADCPAVFSEGLSPGQYFVRGYMNGLRSDSVALSVVP